jgi:hypothetical protein
VSNTQDGSNETERTSTPSSGKAEHVVLPVDLRDHFAGQALNGLVTEALKLDHKSWVATAQHAYTIADVMLAERSK